MKVFKHILSIGAGLFLFAGIPTLYYRVPLMAMYGSGDVDSVSGASLVAPEQPSGEFLVLINKKLHTETMDDWKAFFNEEPVGVIFEDIKCITADGDVNGSQLAERYRIRLPENQMSVKSENGLMAVSKAQCGLFDVMVLSREMGDVFDIGTLLHNPDIECMTITDHGEEAQETGSEALEDDIPEEEKPEEDT